MARAQGMTGMHCVEQIELGELWACGRIQHLMTDNTNASDAIASEAFQTSDKPCQSKKDWQGLCLYT